MEASQKKVAEALEKLKGQMNEIAKRLEQGYYQAAAAEESHPAMLTTIRTTTKRTMKNNRGTLAHVFGS